MSKDAGDLFPNTEKPLDAQLQVVMNRLRKGMVMAEWERAILRSAGVNPDDPKWRACEPKHGYHIGHIPQGVHGEMSKVVEEIHEAMDAWNQGNILMTLLELSDILGAMEAVCEKHGMKLAHILPSDSVSSPIEWAEVCIHFGTILRNTDAPPVTLFAMFGVAMNAVNRFLWNYNLQLGRLYVMTQATQRAFHSGERRKKVG